MSSNDGQGVSSCYVFKSRLQEYAQKAGLVIPIYHTIKEGPSHQPLFRSTVVVNEVSYHSLTGFLNRKAAEQSAAEVALVEISKSGATDKSVSHPVHETGLCKNLLQEYAQKMNYAIPLYICAKDENKGRESPFTCTVDIGGIKYIGAAAKTKKEAELKAARTALLAIQMSGPESTEKPEIESVYTVVPAKRKVPECSVVATDDTVKTGKRKKGRFHKRRKKRGQKPNGSSVEVKDSKSNGGNLGDKNGDLSLTFDRGESKDSNFNGDSKSKSNGGNLGDKNGDLSLTFDRGESKDSNFNGGGGVLSSGECVLVHCGNLGEKNGDLTLTFDRAD